MGNVFHRARTSHLRQSEIQFDRFNQTYNVTQYPKNLNFPFDNELYPITHRLNHQLHILKRMTFFSEEALNSFLNRLDHAITLKHDNLLDIESYYVQKNDMNGRIVSYSVNIIIEHFDHTLREDLIINQHDSIPFSESQVYDVLSQMADALGFLQTHNYCHGNVCPSNIYVTRENKYKLCFIGEPLYKTETGLNPHIISFMDYLAPKLRASLNTAITTGTLPSKVFYDKHKSDIFSLGIILLQMASLKDVKCLNLAGKENERMKRVQGCQKLVAPRLLDSIKAMLTENEVKRPNFVDLKGVIQLQQDEQSDLLGLNRLRRDTYITAMPKQEPRKSSTKMDQCIEMKTIENYGENQEWVNRRYDPSIIDEDNESPLGPKSNKETLEPYRLDDEEIRKFHKDRQSQSVDPVALGYEYMQLRKRTQAPNGLAKISEENKSERLVKAKSVFSKDDIVITQEEDLFQLIDFQVKRLVIKLGGQPQRNNIAQVISELISTQKQLEELALTLPNMSLGDQGIITVIQGMSGLENLRVLFIEFRKDKVTVEGVKVLGHMIRKNKKLVQLGIDLATNSLSVDVCRELADVLHGLDSVKSLALNVGRNRIGNEGLMEISRAISELVSLESLVLFVYSNEIDDGKAIEMLTDNVEKLQKLKSFAVDLSDNALKDESAGILLEFLKRSKTLRVSVELVNNCMSENMREKMKKEMIENPTIQLKS